MAQSSAQIADLPRRRVAIVDDDDLFRESLGLNLQEEGYEVVEFANGQDALDHFIDGDGADAVLLDWRMPVLDGLATLRRLREAGIAVPVIFLTMLGDHIYEEAALQWGAIDFIDKSRSLSIILRRLKLITDGTKLAVPEAGAQANLIRRGPLELRIDSHRALWQGKRVDLTLTEFNIVRKLASQLDRDVPYRDIYDLVHGKDFVSGHGADGYRGNVRSFIKRIRQKFRDVDEDFRQIENYPGFGYRWVDRE
jgi:two-component system response regulator ChvI